MSKEADMKCALDNTLEKVVTDREFELVLMVWYETYCLYLEDDEDKELFGISKELIRIYPEKCDIIKSVYSATVPKAQLSL